jgi:D-alanine--D-alanine ligase
MCLRNGQSKIENPKSKIQMKHMLRVAVLMGGPSEEHEVSLKSGQGAVEALRQRGFAAESVIIPRDASTNEACETVRRAIASADVDVVFIALHGAFGEDGTIQQVCELLHVAYTGSDAAASKLGMDKIASRRRFLEAGLDVPRSRVVEVSRHGSAAPRGLRLPLVVKPSAQGSSIGVSLVRRPSEFAPAVQEAARYGGPVLVEEFVPGRELTVSVLGDEVLPVVEVIPKRAFFDFAAKYTAGMTDYRVPAFLSSDVAHRVQEAGRRAHEALGCRHFSRTDLILSEAQIPVVLEVNTIPGLTPTSLLPKAAACLGISYGELCEQLVMMACPAQKLAAVGGAGHGR